MGLFSFIGGLLGLSSGPSQRIQVSKASAAAGLPIIYGRRRVTPVKVFKTVSQSNAPEGSYPYDHSFITLSGSKYEEERDNYDFLHRVDVWGQGEISAIEKFWVDGDAATVARFKKRPYFRALSNYGSDSQTAMTALSAASSRWTSSHRGAGVAYTWSRFYNSSSKPQFTAEPEVKAEIKGLKVYDPRQDSTQPGGSGSQRQGFPSSWTYSENRALLVLDYLRASYGFAADASEIDMESFMVAADQCDQTMDIPPRLKNETGGTIYGWWDRELGIFINIGQGQYYPTFRPRQVGTTQPRWHGAAVLDPKNGVVENLKLLLEGFGWALSWSNGRHRLVLEDQTSNPVASFDESSIIGGWTSLRGNREGRLNRITVQFQNENKNFEDDTVSWPEKGSTTHTNFLIEDGGQDLHTNKQVKTVTDFYRAQAYAEYLVRKSRVAYQIQGMQLAPQAMLLEPGDVIEINYAAKGFTGEDKLFIVEKVQVSPTLEVTVDLLKYEDSVYNPDARSDEPLDNSMDIADLWLDPPALNDLTVVSVHESKVDGSVISGLDVSWQAPGATVGIDRIEVSWREHTSPDLDNHAADGDYPNTAYVARDVTSFRIPSLADGRNYDVRVVYWTQRGQQSDEVVQTINLVAASSKLDSIEEGATRNVFRGAYDDSYTYVTGDVVTYQGSSYIFTAATAAVGAEPTEEAYWTLLAAAGTPVVVQYSSFDPPTTPQVTSEWHDTFSPGADLYMRQSTPGGGWTEAIRIVGEAGDAGPYTDYRFTRSAFSPSWDEDNANPGGAWADGPPAGSDPLWMISARKNADGTLASGVTWTAPVLLTGEQGPAGAGFLSGNGAPPAGLGDIGDLYIDLVNANIYKKTGTSSWSLQGNVKADDGDKWHSGTGVPSGSLGTVGDFYIRADTNQIYEKTGTSTWTVNFALTDSLGDLALVDVITTANMADDASSEIEKGTGSGNTGSFVSGGIQNHFLATTSIARDPRGILVQGQLRVRSTDGSNQDVWLKIHRNGNPSQVSAANLIKISVTPAYRLQTIFYLDKGFSATGTTVEYQFWMGWGGSNLDFELSSADVTAWLQKK